MPIKGLPGGDFAGCVQAMRGKVDNPRAFCAWRTRYLTGEWPSEEALEACKRASEAELENAETKSVTYNGVTVRVTNRRSSTRDDKAWMRRVFIGDASYLVHYADPDMPMRRNNADARKAFLTRHNCDGKKDPQAAGFWACYDWANPDEGREAVSEALTLALTETALDQRGNFSGQVIVEGQSKNGNNYYTREALQSIPEVFADAPIYINHTTRAEERERPEGDLLNLVGRLPSRREDFVLTEVDGRLVCKFENGIITSEPPLIQERIRTGIWRDMRTSARGEGEERHDGLFYVTRFVQHPRTSLDLVTIGAAGGRAELQENLNTEHMEATLDKQERIKKLEAELAELTEGTSDAVNEAVARYKIPPEFAPAIRTLVEEMALDKKKDDEAMDEKPEEEAEQEEGAMYKEQAVPELEGLPEGVAQMFMDAMAMAQEEGKDELQAKAYAWRAVVDHLLGMLSQREEEAKTEALTIAAQSAARAVKETLASVDAGHREGVTHPISEAARASSLDDELSAWGVKKPTLVLSKLRGGS